MDNTDVVTICPEWFGNSVRPRSCKLRLRVLVFLAAGVLLLYVFFAGGGGGGAKKRVNTAEAAITLARADRRGQPQWKISNRSRLKPVAIDKIIDSQAHAPQRVRLMGPDEKRDDQEEPRAGYVGVPSGINAGLKPPPGPGLARDKGSIFAVAQERANARMMVVDAGMGIGVAADGNIGAGPRARKVGPPGQSQAMHLVGGALPGDGIKAHEGVLVAPAVDRSAGGRQKPSMPPMYVHLDLRLGPPKVNFVEAVMPILASWGATGLIVDYEDNFPYSGVLQALASPAAYSINDVQRIAMAARRHGLSIIPLVQTLSNAQFILKHSEYHPLRERPDSLQDLNPLHNETLRLVGAMIDQTLDAHPGVEHLHLGCEEIYHLGHSPESKAFLRTGRQQRSPTDLYLHHVTSVAQLLKRRYPRIQPIIWDNVLQRIDVAALKRSNLGDFVEPVISLAALQMPRTQKLISKYAQVFPGVWVASYYNQPTLTVADTPSLLHYVGLQLSWLNGLASLQRTVTVRGFVLRGGQRTGHFAPVGALLLPGTLPTLGVSLRLLIRGRFNLSTLHDVTSRLACPVNERRVPDAAEDAWLTFVDCSFPGSRIYADFVAIRNIVLQMRQIIDTKGQHDVSPVVRECESLLSRLPENLLSVYNVAVAREWLDYHLIQNLSPLGGFKAKAKTALHSNKLLIVGSSKQSKTT